MEKKKITAFKVNCNKTKIKDDGFFAAIITGCAFTLAACTGSLHMDDFYGMKNMGNMDIPDIHIGSMEIDYIPREHLYSPDSAGVKKPSGDLAAFRLRKKNKEDEGEGRLFILKRQNDSYMAETGLTEGEKNRIFFAIGANPEYKSPAFGVRVEF